MAFMWNLCLVKGRTWGRGEPAPLGLLGQQAPGSPWQGCLCPSKELRAIPATASKQTERNNKHHELSRRLSFSSGPIPFPPTESVSDAAPASSRRRLRLRLRLRRRPRQRQRQRRHQVVAGKKVVAKPKIAEHSGAEREEPARERRGWRGVSGDGREREGHHRRTWCWSTFYGDSPVHFA